MNNGIPALLDLQESILRLQIEIQKDIAAAKQRRPRDADTHLFLEQLRHVRHLSRTLGDSLAWVTLLFDRQVIHSLYQESPVPISSGMTDSHHGTLAFARANTRAEWGLPIVHDITDILRVGDVTFMRPTGGREPLAEYRTFELKVSRAGAGEVDASGKQDVELHVMAVSNEPFPNLAGQVATMPDESAPAEPAARRPDRRIDRQMARMDVARDRKYAPFHELAQIGTERIFTLKLEREPEPEWGKVRAAIRAARRDGYSYFSLDGFVGYALFYNRNGITDEDIQSVRLSEDITRTVMHEELGSRNSLTINQIPALDHNDPATLTLPFFLWKVPRNAIRDVIRHRLVIMAVFNSGRMEKLLKDAGVEVRPAVGGKDYRNFEVVVPLSWDNARGEYHAGGPWDEMLVAVREFRQPSAVVMRVRAAARIPDHLTAQQLMVGARAPGTEDVAAS
ncbi:hypothetical protein [Leifsonia sp. 1010]|uniref:hypothetical protein n=1 Tax=Leifsonia sp. 1010 TaxID=2817769 RepID=UPI00285D590F|nr:hypothetical protein [Leifsonia sp. 1010]MDR6611103.1 hypothetical protein [Leifsonia sp. 1010]